MGQKLYKSNLRDQGCLIWALVIFSLVSLFWGLGKRSLWEPDEGRYAEISREMVESGDWLTPRLNYIKHFDKPPVAYWLIGSSFKLFGQNEFAGHLPLVLLGLGGVLATFFIGQGLFGSRCGFLCAIILISSLGYPAISHVLSADITFTFFCILCYLFFIRRSYFFFYLAMALAFMTKGPVVLVITLLPISLFLIWTKDKFTFRQMHLGWGLLLFVLVGFPWFIYQILLNKGLINDWFFQQTINRIVHSREQPFYFFIPVLGGFFFPWIFFTIYALRRYLSFKRIPLCKDSAKTLLLFLWFIIPFIFFSFIGKKLVPYIVPVLPPLAIITARLWEEIFDHPQMLLSKIFTRSYYLLVLCLGILLSAMITMVLCKLDYKLGIEAARGNIILMCIILAAEIIISLRAFKLKLAKNLFWVITLSTTLFFLAAVDLLPKIEDNISKSLKSLALKIKADLKPQDKIVNYRCFLRGLPFYLSRRTIVVERERNLAYEEDPKEAEEYILRDKEDLYRLLRTEGFKVYCITYTWEFEKIKQELSQPIYFLAQAGKYVLFANRK